MYGVCLTLWRDSFLYHLLTVLLSFGLATAYDAATRELDEAQQEKDGGKETDEAVGSNGLQEHEEESEGYGARFVYGGRPWGWALC